MQTYYNDTNPLFEFITIPYWDYNDTSYTTAQFFTDLMIIFYQLELDNSVNKIVKNIDDVTFVKVEYPDEEENLYVRVYPTGTENPYNEGWYEKSGDTYVKTADIVVDTSKIYYVLQQTFSTKPSHTSVQVRLTATEMETFTVDIPVEMQMIYTDPLGIVRDTEIERFRTKNGLSNLIS